MQAPNLSTLFPSFPQWEISSHYLNVEFSTCSSQGHNWLSKEYQLASQLSNSMTHTLRAIYIQDRTEAVTTGLSVPQSPSLLQPYLIGLLLWPNEYSASANCFTAIVIRIPTACRSGQCLSTGRKDVPPLVHWQSPLNPPRQVNW